MVVVRDESTKAAASIISSWKVSVKPSFCARCKLRFTSNPYLCGISLERYASKSSSLFASGKEMYIACLPLYSAKPLIVACMYAPWSSSTNTAQASFNISVGTFVTRLSSLEVTTVSSCVLFSATILSEKRFASVFISSICKNFTSCG